MTKLTIVTDRRGKLIGAVQGHELSQRIGEVQAEVSFEPGHKLHMVDANIDLTETTDPKQLEKRLAGLVPKSAARSKTKGARR